MSKTKETVNLKAASVEACRICLATDTKLHSLQSTYLATSSEVFALLEAVVGYQKSYKGLPNYICYQCAPCLVKCHKLIEKCKISQAALEDMYKKNGQITKPLIEKQNRSELKLQTLDSYELINYYYIKYDDDNNREETSDFIKTKPDPDAQTNGSLEHELQEAIEELSEKEILDILQKSLKNQDTDESSSDSDVQAIEVDIPTVEIASDDEKAGDDFISLKTYNVTVDREPGNFNKCKRPIYNRAPGLIKNERPKVKEPRRKKKKINNNEYNPMPVEPYVRKFFNVTKTSGTISGRKFSCKSCPATFPYPEEAKDHTYIGCPNAAPRVRAGTNTAPKVPRVPSAVPKVPTGPNTAPKVPGVPSAVPKVSTGTNTAPKVSVVPSVVPKVLTGANTAPKVPGVPSAVSRVPGLPSAVPRAPSGPNTAPIVPAGSNTAPIVPDVPRAVSKV
ncbi:OTU domain-containing protein 4-like [Helicoverpa zea]|uniref:OTU domain-containing protein 4-like n=1 Tax=Helicoverpa zea TaxID=7113 RepID=UPI001F59936C|nr:OTU domain-containing protein 4-like [Helicoverpa zea]